MYARANQEGIPWSASVCEESIRKYVLNGVEGVSGLDAVFPRLLQILEYI